MFSLSRISFVSFPVTVSWFSLAHGSHDAHHFKLCVCLTSWSACFFFSFLFFRAPMECARRSISWWECVTPVLFLSVCMEQCENAASLLASVREQEMQFERLTRALEEERRSVGPSGTLPRPLPTLQVTPSQPITQQQGSPHHHPARSHPCRITLHQCVLVGTSRSMTINPSFTVAFSVTRTHHLHPFLLLSSAAHPLPSASFCS